MSPNARIPISSKSPESSPIRMSPVIRCSSKLFERWPRPEALNQSITFSIDQLSTSCCWPSRPGPAGMDGTYDGGGTSKGTFSNPGGGATGATGAAGDDTTRVAGTIRGCAAAGLVHPEMRLSG